MPPIPEPARKPLTPAQEKQVIEIHDAIAVDVRELLNKERDTEIDLSREQLQSRIDEVVARHLTDDEAMDDEILALVQGLRDLLDANTKPRR